MAVSDPTTDVPTPTGTLQGVAVFSWDGSAWQPSGRAGPSVATPTGVLRGVAAFNGGPAWQPAGLAQPGVTTPTGTLDGVAVYTWTGDSWAPPGGTATPSTAHGALRGVAAFNWDGAAWQPAGQAGPSVATPYGVLDGVAMFGWTGSAWTAAAVGAASLSLDFMQPGTLDPRIAFSRGSTATYFDATGTMQTAAINAPRWDYNPNTLALNGLLIEEQRTNVLLNSAVLNTQSVTVAAQAYTLSFYGTGTITKSGVAAGALVGTGATQRVSQTFTPTAGSLTCTVTGTVTNAQLEAGGFATSYIPVLAAAVTRSADVATMPTAAWFNAAVGTEQVEFIATNVPPAGVQAGILRMDDGSDNNVAEIYLPPSTSAVYFYGGAAAAGQINLTIAAISGTPQKAAMTYGAPLWNGAMGGVVAAGSGSATPAAFTRMMFGMNNASLAWFMNGWLRRVRYWPRVLSNAELQAVTT